MEKLNLENKELPKAGRLLTPERYQSIESLTPEEKREQYFTALMYDKLIDSYESSMRKVGFSEEQINEFYESMNVYASFEDLGEVLSLPYEIRDRRLGYFKELIDSGEMTVSQMTEQLHEDAKAGGYTVGYHISNLDIKKEKDKIKNIEKWEIKSYEMDDRDDRPQAYYSLGYNLYDKKSFSYIYFIRAHLSEEGGHRKDGNNNWGRSDSLSIIDRVKMTRGELNEQIENIEKGTA